MARTRLAFTWTLTFGGDHLMASEVEPDVRRVLAYWTDHPKYRGRFADLSVGGVAYGIMQIKMTITGRDQWAVRKQSKWIARALMSAAHVKYVEVAEPKMAKLPPHEHRGSRRFEAPKYAEAAHG